MNQAMAQQLCELMEECDADTDLRCPVLRGAGGKAFSAGADISEFEQLRSTKEHAPADAKVMMASRQSVAGCRHPTIALIGDVFDAADAMRMGLVNRIAQDHEVTDATYVMAEEIAEGAPLVVRWHKKFIYRHLDPTPLSAAEREEGYDCFDTEDFQIGYKAFLAKQKPTFVGR